METLLAKRLLRSLFAALFFSTMLSGCLTTKMYVDPALPVVTKAELPAISDPQPAALLFEFRTKGNPNARATKEVRPMVISALQESGLFSTLTDTTNDPAGAQLKIVIDNIPLTDNAAAKGFGTGLTFGLAGSMVTDGYVATATYTANGKTTETTVKHAIHTTVGNHGGPDGLEAVPMQTAVSTIVNQMVLTALKNLAEKQAIGEK